ncbi:hypothetical protein MLP_01060 [Microlunatus phosphovorus NM-1]|uniref:HNH domain-containing protein n=1 Tax=Microlunatus phosphovorus (strain ATCC 700054 / DSM 10555 / JCM 9379 / NBRC 101784 / NCIMB 13414 / VKM Ac-1990 / NM-1) TaxID=1032480 RepID=F5XGL3_MICPN|nr:HNH endonuclease signature motif containing protein [Microlunatus phosphovorus]BAK33120.1 hypothetical protein MLP_01060 [Microlunatus phosphovorus NM-1]
MTTQAANSLLAAAKAGQKDEFYTQSSDIEKELRIYELNEMDADHVTAWSKGGASDLANCEMLCVPHNRSKGNR